jgi:zinc/manganese transport system permease protein
MLLFQYPFMLTALALCLALTGIHTYLGYHVVKRGVIFVDLSLAQVAALGAAVGLLLGWGDDPVRSYLISLGFTLMGAVLFAFFRMKQEKVPVEALIGITYAGAAAISLLVLEKAATGTDELKEMLVGSLLTVSARELVFIACLYSVIGIIHALSRKALFAVTEDAEAAKARGLKVWFWDFLFYTTFGFVVTSSVKVAGVLLVFAFLVIPSVSAVVMTQGTIRRLLYGWAFGMVGCVWGLELSLRMDWPAGPSVVVAFLVQLILSFAVSAIRPSRGA